MLKMTLKFKKVKNKNNIFEIANNQITFCA